VTQFRVEPLSGHDRSRFDCGNEALNLYFRKQVSQDIRRSFTACYVLVDKHCQVIAGYYTLSAGGVLFSEIPDASKLPKYPTVPVARMGRLAIDLRYQGQRLGNAILVDALERVKRSGIGIYALAVDAKDEKAASFYLYHGFIRLVSQPLILFLPLEIKKQNA
jgi:GNAT superfamily N-acetyltransferase